jgi:hypothetical protein
VRVQRHETSEAPGYVKPEVVDYGDLRDVTEAQITGTRTDVPKGTPVPPFSIFS